MVCTQALGEAPPPYGRHRKYRGLSSPTFYSLAACMRKDRSKSHIGLSHDFGGEETMPAAFTSEIVLEEDDEEEDGEEEMGHDILKKSIAEKMLAWFRCSVGRSM